MKKSAQTSKHLALCLDNQGYPASLELGKLYRMIPDAEANGYLRIVDESGEDYAYASRRFYLLKLPAAVEEKLLHAA